jgi:hypothetical protein
VVVGGAFGSRRVLGGLLVQWVEAALAEIREV